MNTFRFDLYKFPSKIVPFALLFAFKWQFVQLLAWSTMLIRYSLKYGFWDGVDKTFSGDYPCLLCQLSETGTSAELAVWQILFQRPSIIALPLAGVAYILISRKPLKTI